MMVIAALFETIGIGLIVPFVGIATDPQMIHDQYILNFLYSMLNFQSTNSFLMFATICLMLVFVFKNIYLVFFYYLQYRFVYNQQVRHSQSLFQAYLTKPYTFHLQKNTAELLRNVNNEVPRVFNSILIPGFLLLTELIVITCIVTLLLFIAPKATLFSALLLTISVTVFFKLFRNKISKLGEVQQFAQGQMIKWINQGLGASKEVKVSGKERFFIQNYLYHSENYAYSIRFYQLLNQVPRMFIEIIVVSTILLMMLLIILQGSDMTTLLSTMALFAMAAFRLMPSINRIVNSLASIRYNYLALEVIYKDLYKNKNASIINLHNESWKNDDSKKAFHHSIELKNVFYRYPNQNQYSINGISLTIPIGQSVAFIGPSGAGKTTLVDLILGLLKPESGKILIDDKEFLKQYPTWQKKIGYIPQTIYLSDDSIRKNVAFGIDETAINDETVWRALENAQLKSFVEQLPNQLNTFVGERGVRLSGGQRQRIGIARALYHNPEILFLDEATSALDTTTEKEIMNEVNALKGQKTIIIIAHRISTIEKCDIVFTIINGELSD